MMIVGVFVATGMCFTGTYIQGAVRTNQQDEDKDKPDSLNQDLVISLLVGLHFIVLAAFFTTVTGGSLPLYGLHIILPLTLVVNTLTAAISKKWRSMSTEEKKEWLKEKLPRLSKVPGMTTAIKVSLTTAAFFDAGLTKVRRVVAHNAHIILPIASLAVSVLLILAGFQIAGYISLLGVLLMCLKGTQRLPLPIENFLTNTGLCCSIILLFVMPMPIFLQVLLGIYLINRLTVLATGNSNFKKYLPKWVNDAIKGTFRDTDTTQGKELTKIAAATNTRNFTYDPRSMYSDLLKPPPLLKGGVTREDMKEAFAQIEQRQRTWAIELSESERGGLDNLKRGLVQGSYDGTPPENETAFLEQFYSAIKAGLLIDEEEDDQDKFGAAYREFCMVGIKCPGEWMDWPCQILAGQSKTLEEFIHATMARQRGALLDAVLQEMEKESAAKKHLFDAHGGALGVHVQYTIGQAARPSLRTLKAETDRVQYGYGIWDPIYSQLFKWYDPSVTQVTDAKSRANCAIPAGYAVLKTVTSNPENALLMPLILEAISRTQTLWQKIASPEYLREYEDFQKRKRAGEAITTEEAKEFVHSPAAHFTKDQMDCTLGLKDRISIWLTNNPLYESMLQYEKDYVPQLNPQFLEEVEKRGDDGKFIKTGEISGMTLDGVLLAMSQLGIYKMQDADAATSYPQDYAGYYDSLAASQAAADDDSDDDESIDLVALKAAREQREREMHERAKAMRAQPTSPAET